MSGRPRSLAHFEMIAGEDAEAAGVDRQRLVDAELGREVGDGPLRGEARRETLCPLRLGRKIRGEAIEQVARAGAKARIDVELGQPRERRRVEEAPRGLWPLSSQRDGLMSRNSSAPSGCQLHQ